MEWKEFLDEVDCKKEEYLELSTKKIEVKRSTKAFVSSGRSGESILKEFLIALKTDGMLLNVILSHSNLEKDRIKEICLEAVKQNGLALQDVPEQTPEVCIAAVEQNKNALGYVDRTIFED